MKSIRLAQRLWCRPPSGARNTVATGGMMLRLVAGAILVVVVVVTTAIAFLHPTYVAARSRAQCSLGSMPPEHEPAETHAAGEDRQGHRGIGTELTPGDHADCVLWAGLQSNDRSKLTRREAACCSS